MIRPFNPDCQSVRGNRGYGMGELVLVWPVVEKLFIPLEGDAKLHGRATDTLPRRPRSKGAGRIVTHINLHVKDLRFCCVLVEDNWRDAELREHLLNRGLETDLHHGLVANLRGRVKGFLSSLVEPLG